MCKIPLKKCKCTQAPNLSYQNNLINITVNASVREMVIYESCTDLVDKINFYRKSVERCEILYKTCSDMERMGEDFVSCTNFLGGVYFSCISRA